MWRSLFAAILLLTSLEASATLTSLLPQAYPSDDFVLYLPLVAASPVAQAVVTARGERTGYPTEYYVYGYVRSLVSEPLQSILLDIDITIFPYDDPPPPSYITTVQVTPALTATLPGQINPFAYSLLLGKASASIGDVRVAQAYRIPAGGDLYEPLAILDWEYANQVLSGTARNDNDHPLVLGRVVVAELQRCAWREAVLDSLLIQPGQETTFRLSYSAACLGDQLVITGQGVKN